MTKLKAYAPNIVSPIYLVHHCFNKFDSVRVRCTIHVHLYAVIILWIDEILQCHLVCRWRMEVRKKKRHTLSKYAAQFWSFHNFSRTWNCKIAYALYFRTIISSVENTFTNYILSTFFLQHNRPIISVSTQSVEVFCHYIHNGCVSVWHWKWHIHEIVVFCFHTFLPVSIKVWIPMRELDVLFFLF